MYTKGCGQTHGEVIEEGWSQSNKAASQTKEMGPGTRAMTLDDIFGFCNWQTIENLDKVLGQRLINAVKEFDAHYEDFTSFNQSLVSSIGLQQLKEWENLVDNWDRTRNQDDCPYESNTDDVDNFKNVQIELAKEENEKMTRGISVQSSSMCVFLVEGIEIQESQRGIGIFITNGTLTPTQELELQKRRSSLWKQIQHFRSIQKLLMPRIDDVISPADLLHINTPNVSQPEKIKLILPSDLKTSAMRNCACVGGLVEEERRLREGETRDALERVRSGLRARTMTHWYKI
ncbi:hypothetical protein VKT23_016347 [Stygiomarasmius scandens]|uniref:Uncharacterized protein n=1 Tax=Marasmiellus scandens TaxID=2682957 RepID=A0ABR1IYP3_9AGAR